MNQQILLGPEWFFRIELWSDVFSIIVLSLIALYITKTYNLVKNKKYIVFIASVYMLVLGLLLKVISNYITYYQYVDTGNTGLAFDQSFQASIFGGWILVALLTYKLLTLVGFYFLYHVYNRQDSKSTILLTTVLIAMTVFLSYYQHYAFHIVYLFILALISAQYWNNYRTYGLGNTGLLATSFSLLALSQITFILSSLHSMFFVVAEAIQLIGYLLLLTTFILVLIHGKKKEQARHNN